MMEMDYSCGKFGDIPFLFYRADRHLQTHRHTRMHALLPRLSMRRHLTLNKFTRSLLLQWV